MQGGIAEICSYFLMELLYSFVVYEYFLIFFQKKEIRGIFVYIYAINVVGQGIVSYCIPDHLAYCRIIIVFLILVWESLFFEGRMGQKVVFLILFVALCMLGELLIACAFVACDISISGNGKVGYCITYMMILLLVLILQYYFHNMMVATLSWKTYLKVMLLPIGSIFFAYLLFYTQYEMGIYGLHWKTMISIAILLSMNVMMFNIISQLSENLELQRKTSIYEKEFALLEQHVHEREALMQEFRTKRHDLKHQMLNLLTLLKTEDYETLESDIKRLAEQESLDGLFFVHTENSLIDTFINSKYAIMHEKGIDFKVKLDIPVELPFAGEDLCVVLGNAFDNAIEACMRGMVPNPYIMFQMVYDGNNLVIVLENSFDGKIKKSKSGTWHTRKENIQQHGIGIYSIKNTIKKYNGYYDVEIEKEIYRLKLILYAKEE